MDWVTALLEATVRAATPLALAALGELLIERGGQINIGLEGSVLAGALGAAIVAEPLGAHAGLLGGAAAGALIGALFAVFTIALRTDQIITGTALTLLVLGTTGALARTLFSERGIALTLPMLPVNPIPGLQSIPVLGPALFAQPYIAYFAVLLAIGIHWWLTRTHAGLALRAVGESRENARVAGIQVDRVQWAAVLVGSLLAGISGAVLVLAQSGTFVEGMSAGRGFIAIAIVALGRWRPLPVLLAALLFGATTAAQYTAQTFGWTMPYQVFLAAPYLATLIVLFLSARRLSPASLSQRGPSLA
ncbi:MAG TPA: ABC transporter permease [Gemmatimonadaceae bacterium]|nr:ABC transporter permease [Gemmatimonadaceae bacterium]